MPQQNMNLPNKLKADLFLLHAPSVFDFRERDDILFAYLSDSDSVNVTSIYEMFPLGFFSIKQRLCEHGFKVDIVNVASLMLRCPKLDVSKLLARLEAPVFGIDLHFMPHCHGSIELANKLKSIHPDSLIIFGGISATYYSAELIQYPAVDVVLQGYDTLEPLTSLIAAVKSGIRAFDSIPNLVFKRDKKQIVSTGFTHKPKRKYNDATVDWSYYSKIRDSLTASKLIMTLPNAGCSYDCSWCGGSRFAYRNIMKVQKTLIPKDINQINQELRTLSDAAKKTSIYALQCYSETKPRFHMYLDAIKEIGYKSVFFEQFHLTSQTTLKKMGESTRAYIMLSPESHDPVISRLAGRGNYTMAEMEEWIPNALDAGITGIMVWFFIGMPQQTTQSVLDTVAYCESLLKKFRGKKVVPLICPMVPFLDVGSRIFEEPHNHGYRIFCRSLEEHRMAMVEPLWYKRLNYETVCMSRKDIQNITYEAIARLVNIKHNLGVLPSSFCKPVLETIDQTKLLLSELEHSLELDGKLPPDLRNAIRTYTRKILAYSSDQIIPAPRPFGGRWFDDFTVPLNMISEIEQNQNHPDNDFII
jgi:clorobiocin biosynthesis protein CloN6